MKVEISIDEAVETIKRSNLPTVVTEGRDDYVIYRRLEQKLSDIGISFLPVGGKGAALEIWNKVRLFGKAATAIVDKDMWVYSGVPDDYSNQNLILTDGYSIENDLYRDGNFEALLSDDEKNQFEIELQIICAWYDGQISHILQGSSAEISLHPNQILQLPAISNCNTDNTTMGIYQDYAKLLRGKTLVKTIMRQLARPNRTPKHSFLSMFEFAACLDGPHMATIEASVRQAFSG